MKVFYPSLDRLAVLADDSSQDPSRLASSSVEFSRILHDLRIGGVWKWTDSRRLQGMDNLLSDYIAAQGWSSLRMLDVGASDGITTVDTVAHVMQKNKIPVMITMLERNTRLYSIRKNRKVIYFTGSHRPILARFGRFALCLESMEGIEGIVFNRLAALVSRRYAAILEREDLSGARPIWLVNPRVLNCPSIEVCERDLFNPEPKWCGIYDAVRASNVLNFSYYSESDLVKALAIIHRYLKEAGALLVSRNLIGKTGETELGGLWQKKGEGFVGISRIKQLPELTDLVNRFRSS